MGENQKKQEHKCEMIKLDTEGFRGFSDRLKSKMEQKLAILNFSGVTEGLDDVHEALNGQGQITKKGGINLS